MRKEMEELKYQLQLLSMFLNKTVVLTVVLTALCNFFLGTPPAFSCYRSSPQWNEGVITYTKCNVRADGMNRNSGVFTVTVPGAEKNIFLKIILVSIVFLFVQK